MTDASTDTKTFWNKDATYWLDKLHSTERGLSSEEAKNRFRTDNKKTRERSSLEADFRLFLSQFRSPLMLLLLGAVVLSAFLGDTSDVSIILFVLLSTGIMSFIQERKAGKVVEKLRAMLAMRSTVLRDGAPQEMPSDALVVGDVVTLKAGDLIPADCLIIACNELHVNEAGLTGESFPVRKSEGVVDENTPLAARYNCLWQGTSIVSGNATALVIHLGEDTIFSTISSAAGKSKLTSFEIGIRDFGYLLMKITLILSMFILIINLINHKNVIDSALFALALAVGMAPELLPAITTIAMSSGANRLLARKVIVKKLSAIQNLGEINLLCTDKTGTITEGNIAVSGILNASLQPDEWVREMAVWNAHFETGYANPIDDALRALQANLERTVSKIGEVPYDFIRKRLSIGLQHGDEKWMITKGAFRELLACCTQLRVNEVIMPLISSEREKLEAAYTQFGEGGQRVIAIAYKPIAGESITATDETELIFAGFILFQDPVKQDIVNTISALKDLQVSLKIITGDNRNVARSIAMQIGLSNPVVMTGEELVNTSQEALTPLVQRTHIFAEVEPQQKERLIRALRNSYTVAYMGDGINDVSALSAADVGISVSNAVDVARDAADFVLMEKDLTVLVDGIKEGRKTFANTLKYTYINTGATFGNMCSVAVASIILPFLPMLPKQILLTNFITDFPYLTIASDNVDEEQIAIPGKWDMKAIRNYMVVFGVHSSLFDVFTFLVLLYFMDAKESLFQTGWFIESVLSELFILFIIRTHQNFFRSRPARALLLLSLLGLLLTIALPYVPFAGDMGFVPLSISQLLAMLGIVLLYIFTADLLKVWFFRRIHKLSGS